MLDKLEAIKARFDQLGVALTNPAIVNDNKKICGNQQRIPQSRKDCECIQ